MKGLADIHYHIDKKITHWDQGNFDSLMIDYEFTMILQTVSNLHPSFSQRETTPGSDIPD